MLMDASARSRSRTCASPIWSSARAARWCIGMNKWDLMEGKPGAAGKLRAEADHWLPQVKGVPVVALSGLTGAGLDRLMQAVVDAHAVWNRRVPTKRAQPLARGRGVGASAAGGDRAAASGSTTSPRPRARPPSFVLFCSRADAVPGRLPALSGQQPARELRSARHADPADLAREEESVSRAGRQTEPR